MKYLYYTLSAIAVYILQATALQGIAIMDIKPNIILILVVCIAFLKGENDGFFTGVAAGLIQDCYSGHYIGSNVFIYGLIGYFVGHLCADLYKENIMAPMGITLVASFCYDFLFYVINVLLNGFVDILYFIKWKIVPGMVYNALISLVMYMIVYYIISSYESRTSRYRI